MMTFKTTGLFLLATFLSVNSSTLYAYDPSEDVAGASDSPFFERYSRSKIDQFSQQATSDYLLALDSPKTVNGVMQIEYSERLSGELTRITYRSPDGESSEQIFKHFREQLGSVTHELLFECHGRECGSSNQWANRILGIPKLYGPQRYQHYLAAQIEGDDGPFFLALYSIQRGNKRVYTQLDTVIPDSRSDKSLDANPETILTRLKDEGIFTLRNLVFDENDQLTEPSVQRLKPVIVALKKNIRLKYYVVGHLSEDLALDELKSRSLARAESVVSALSEQGVRSDQISAQGVGPLAPAGLENSRITLVLQ